MKFIGKVMFVLDISQKMILYHQQISKGFVTWLYHHCFCHLFLLRNLKQKWRLALICLLHRLQILQLLQLKIYLKRPFSFPFQLLPSTVRDGEVHEEPMTNSMENMEEYEEEYNDFCNLCRICLTIAENMVLMESPLCEGNGGEETTEITILEAIEKLMSQKVFTHKKWPSSICETCRQLLKQAYDLNVLFHHSQESLREIFKDNLSENEHILDHTCISEKIQGSIDESGDGEEQNVHLETEEKENNFETKLVEKVFTMNEISLDINSTGEESLLRKLLSTPTNLIKNKKPKKAFRCTFCNQILHKMKQVANHKRRCRMRPKLLSCRSCGARNRVIGDGNEFLCDGCGSVSKVQKSRDFLCYICGRTFLKRQRALHMLTHSEKRFECEICNKKFRHKMSLKVHLDIHKNIRNHLCSICGQTFSYRSGLVYHMQKNHTDERNFACEICDKRFFLRPDLTRHLKIHNNRPSACGICGKVCRTVGGSRLHEKMHSGERPHKCRFCERTFIYRPNLAMHEVTHPGPHECYHCEKTFIEVDLLNQHVKLKHRTLLSDKID